MIAFDPTRHPVEVLADEFAERYRCGESPSIEDYADRFPELADEINELFPAIAMMEDLGSHEHAQHVEAESQPISPAQHIERLGDFQVVREIGRGGMGVVYEAVQQSLDRRVAVKILNADAVASPRARERFHREARAAAGLHHTNIVPVFGVGQQDGWHYFVMQFIDGVGLDRVIHHLRKTCRVSADDDLPASTRDSQKDLAAAAAAQALCEGRREGSDRSSSFSCTGLGRQSVGGGRPARIAAIDPAGSTEINGDATFVSCRSAPAEDQSEDQTGQQVESLGPSYFKSVARLGAQLASALSYAHSQGVLHRDIKPSNLLLERGGVVWIADFGLAKQDESEDFTRTGDVVGTLRYMAPEQFSGQADQRSDIYALGLTLYELATLHAARKEKTPAELYHGAAHSSPAPPRKINRSIPRDLETIILKATATEPAARYRTAALLAEDLERFVNELPVLARRVAPWEHLLRRARRNPVNAILSGTALALLVLVAVVATVGNIRTARALARVEQERGRAQVAAGEAERQREKAAAQHQRALQEFDRAEDNLELAMQAFDDIAENLAARGVPHSLELDFDAEDAPPITATVSPADAELLQRMLAFFDEFARRNGADLGAETAAAHRHMGDIRRRLREFEEAETAYRNALGIYRDLARRQPDQAEYVVAAADVYWRLGETRWERGRQRDAMELFVKGRDLLLEQPEEIQKTQAVRYELANSYNRMASASSRDGAWNSRVLPASPGDGRGAEDRSRDQHRGSRHRSGRGEERGRHDESETRDWAVSYREPALVLLQELVNEDPENPRYRLALAECYREHLPMAWREGRAEDAANALELAVEVLESLAADYPRTPRFKFELADTLSITSDSLAGTHYGDTEEARLTRAVEIGRDLAADFPAVAQYEAILANALAKLGSIELENNEHESARGLIGEAVSRLATIADRHRETHVYRVALAQALEGSAALERDTGNLEGARQILEKAIADYEEFLNTQDKRESSYLKRFLASLYLQLAQTHIELNNEKLAEAAQRNAHEASRDPWSGGRGRGHHHRGGSKNGRRGR